MKSSKLPFHPVRNNSQNIFVKKCCYYCLFFFFLHLFCRAKSLLPWPVLLRIRSHRSSRVWRRRRCLWKRLFGRATISHERRIFGIGGRCSMLFSSCLCGVRLWMRSCIRPAVKHGLFRLPGIVSRLFLAYRHWNCCMWFLTFVDDAHFNVIYVFVKLCDELISRLTEFFWHVLAILEFFAKWFQP